MNKFELEKKYRGEEDHPIITVERSYVSGFSNGKGWRTCTTTYRYDALITYGNNCHMIGTRMKVVFDNGTVFDWHWKDITLPEGIKSVLALEKERED